MLKRIWTVAPVALLALLAAAPAFHPRERPGRALAGGELRVALGHPRLAHDDRACDTLLAREPFLEVGGHSALVLPLHRLA
ncbi:MAG: hypothetical protein IH608_01875, partial [Proteobacteria bacterium]|nr:hypothetical protein [Pseudomonadota bacterium]